MNEEWNELIQQVGSLIENREKYQTTLGQIAATIQERYGSNALVGFAEDLANTVGQKISPKTLRNYAWVYEKTHTFNLPEDLSYKARQELASVDNPVSWIEKMTLEGWSSAELIRAIKLAKGSGMSKKKNAICPSCGANIEI